MNHTIDQLWNRKGGYRYGIFIGWEDSCVPSTAACFEIIKVKREPKRKFKPIFAVSGDTFSVWGAILHRNCREEHINSFTVRIL